MKLKFKLYRLLFVSLAMFAGAFYSYGQPQIISGEIKDAKTGQPLQLITVQVSGTEQGVNTNSKGQYQLVINGTFTQIQASAIGYKTVLKNIIPGKEQNINFVLSADNKQLNEVVVRAGKKPKYRNRDNPAVELIRQVIAHKKMNRVEGYNYAEYKQYEKMVISLSDLSDKFKNKRIFKNFQLLFSSQDSTAMGGQTMLPLYMDEQLSDNYFRKNPDAHKQVITAQKQVKYDENFVDNQGLNAYFNRMYQDIDIYDNNIMLLSSQMLSPIADNAPTFYKFFITDTIKDQNPQLIELSFTPRNKTDLLFQGHLYVTMDGNYAVENAVLSVNKNINLNFVRQMQASLQFEKNVDGRYHLSNSDLKIDFGLNKNKGGGIFGERAVAIKNFVINQPRDKKDYEGPSLVV